MYLDETSDCLLDLLALLRAVQVIHQNAHWNVKGETYYGDHLLFQRLYEAVGAEIDTLAEKITAMFGSYCVSSSDQASRIESFVSDWEHTYPCYVTRSLYAEKQLQIIFKEAYDFLDECGTLSLGMDDFLMAAANAHETAIYLLQQRVA